MFILFQSEKTGKFHWNLKAVNGQIILTSQAYANIPSAMRGIDSVKKQSQNRKRFEVRLTKDGRPYFVLKAGNGQIVGQSQFYKNQTGCDKGIESVQINAPVVDVQFIDKNTE